MKKTLLLLILAALLPAGCSRHKSGGPGGSQTTQTIAPAPAMPAPTGTDAMTQTVEVADSRSESDGMASNSAMTTTTKSGKTVKTPAKKKGKK